MVSLIVIRVFLISKLILIISLNTADWHNYLDVWMYNVNYCFPGTLNNYFFTMLKYFLLASLFCKPYYFWSYEWKPDVWLIKSKLNRYSSVSGDVYILSINSFECFVALKKKTSFQESYLRRVEERHNNPRNLISQLISCHDKEKLPAWLTSIQLTYFGLS